MSAELPYRQRIAAYGVAVRDGAVLLVRASSRSKLPGRWYLPGGGIEWGESPEAAIVREFGEETGLDVRVSRLVGVVSEVHHFADEHLQTLRICYSVAVTGGRPRAEVDGSSELARWMPVGELDELAVMDFVRQMLAACSESESVPSR